MKLRAILTACAGLSLAACAALSGLDQITESACAPDCTADLDAGVYAMSCWSVDDLRLSSATCP